MTKLDAGLITSLPASDPGSAAVWGSKRINPRPQFCLCLAWSGCPSNDDDDDDHEGAKHAEMLKDKLPTHMAVHQSLIFVHDGAPCQQSKIVKQFLIENYIKILDWPGNSPDLN